MTPTDEERNRCMALAQAEAAYWNDLEPDSEVNSAFQIGAVGALVNVITAIFLGKTAEEYREEVLNRLDEKFKEELPKTQYEYCDRCDGCGWYEGGVTLQTQCEVCGGTGVIDKMKQKQV